MWTRHSLLTLQETAPSGSETNCTSSSLRLIKRGPRQRQQGSRLQKLTCGLELHHFNGYLQKEKVKKQSQDKKPLPKGDKEGATIHSPNNTHSFWPVAL